MHTPTVRMVALCFFLVGASTAQDLSYAQKQAVDRQERNLTEAKGKLKSMQDAWAKDMAELDKPDTLIPPSFFKGYLTKADEVVGKCESMKADLDKNTCPADNPRVKAITDWSAEAGKTVDEFKAAIAPKLAAMEKLADPKNYPELEKDFDQMATLAKAYGLRGFASQPDKVAELAKEFPSATTWSSEKFKIYRPLLVLTGGKTSPLFKKYEAMANSIKGFQEEAGKFFAQAQKDVPELLKKAEEMATQAAADKKPAFFTGGVRQQLDQAESFLKVCRGLVPADDARLASMETAASESSKRIDAQADTLKELIVAETRPPAETYDGGDKEATRGKIMEEWKKAWPKDEVLAIRMHMQGFDRTEKATWDGSDKSWTLDDRSVLAVTVIVKTSAKIATSYPAYVNIDNVSKKTTYGVNTKGSAYVSREMLVENVK